MTKRPTIASLQEEINDLQNARRNDRICMDNFIRTINELKAKLEVQDDLKRQVQWFKQLSQNLSEAICAHMRNR